jgi:hypothetical protein
MASGVASEPLVTQKLAFTHLAQKYQDGEGEPQTSPVPEGESRVSELPSEEDSEKHKADGGSDATRSENASDTRGRRIGRARALLLLRGLLRDDGITHGGRY